jgi:COMPASS component SPP1
MQQASKSKPKAPAKPRAKAASKSSAKTAEGSSGSKGGSGGAKAKKTAQTAVKVQPHSQSPMPGIDADNKMEVDKEEEEQVGEDELYCVCKTRYDEDRVMIACDR